MSFGNPGVYLGLMGVTYGTLRLILLVWILYFCSDVSLQCSTAQSPEYRCKTWEQICSTTKEDWEVARLSLRAEKSRGPHLPYPRLQTWKQKPSRELPQGVSPQRDAERARLQTRKANILPLRGAKIQLPSMAWPCSSTARSPASLLLLLRLEGRFHLWCANKEANKQDAAPSNEQD